VSFIVPPSASLGRPPTVSDDASKGFFEGSTVVDGSANPPVLYVCTSSARGSARWVIAGGVTVQSDGVNAGHAYVLNFAEGAVTTSQGVATFTPPSGWSKYASFVATEGQTLFLVAGVNPDPGRHAVTRNGLLMLLGADADYTVNPAGILFAYPLAADTIVQVLS